MPRTFGFPGQPSPPAMALRQLARIEDALGVMTVALENAASPEFANDGAALILRLIRREVAEAAGALAPPTPPGPAPGRGFRPL